MGDGVSFLQLAPLAGLVANMLGPGSKMGGSPSGGISPQQAALAEFQKKAHILMANSIFASSKGGTPISTGATQMAAGAQLGAAETGAQLSDANWAAQNRAQQQYAQAQGGLAGQAASALFGKRGSGGGGGGAPPQSTVTNVDPALE